MRVLVTGGAGYIGSHTLIALYEAGHTIGALDSFVNSSPLVLKRIEELTGISIPHFQTDILDSAELDKALCDFKPDAVIHFAGLKAVGEGEEQPQRYYATNVGGTINLLSAMEKAGCKKIVFSSSATVYGEPTYLPMDEAHPTSPVNVYGRTKHMAEQILKDWQKSRADASVVLLRYFNPVGAHSSGRIGENPNGVPNNLLPFVAQVAIGKREKVSVFGNDYDTPDGSGMRDYIHVVDLAKAHTSALDYATKHSSCDVFNLGTGTAYSVLDIIHAYSKASGQDIPYQITNRRPGDTACSVADPAKAKRVLNWQAEHNLDQMCKSSWNWQSKNPNGFGDA